MNDKCPDWWRECQASAEPLVTTMNWKQYGGEHIVMNTAAMLEMLAIGMGATYAAYVDELFKDD